ncbi:MAG: hypothetical protein Q4G03_10090 [Planctomycetia bacterium]|nr:hypothetical protein [Planctomycetia bacterium]
MRTRFQIASVTQRLRWTALTLALLCVAPLYGQEAALRAPATSARPVSSSGTQSLPYGVGAQSRTPVPGATTGKPYPSSPGLSPIWRASVPTGEIASFRRFTREVGQFQPIKWKLPQGMKAEVAQLGGFAQAPDETNLFALAVGSVYRFKLSGFETAPNEALYPSVEMIGRLYPPQGREWDFPVEFEIPAKDIDLALKGSFITRVIFVENAANPVNLDASASNEPLTVDAPTSLDPVAAAATRGRPLAIIRLGSREPNAAPEAKDPFFFGLPEVQFKPEIVEKVDIDAIEETPELKDDSQEQAESHAATEVVPEVPSDATAIQVEE